MLSLDSLRKDYYKTYAEIVSTFPPEESTFPQDDVNRSQTADSSSASANSSDESTFLQEESVIVAHRSPPAGSSSAPSSATVGDSGSDTNSESDFTDVIFKATSKSPIQVIVNIMSIAYKAGCNVLNRGNDGDLRNSFDHMPIGNIALSRLQLGPKPLISPSIEVSAVGVNPSTSQRKHSQAKLSLSGAYRTVPTKLKSKGVTQPSQGPVLVPVSTPISSSSSAAMSTPPRSKSTSS